MNPPGADYVSGDIYVGRTGDGARISISVRLALRTNEQENTDHQTVTDRWEISLMGGGIEKGRSVESFGGQIREEFRRVRGVKGVKAVSAIWDTYHLNGMAAGCDHQSRPGDLDTTPPCPVTGYRYGHAWLYRELPAEAVVTVLDFLQACSDRTPEGARRTLRALFPEGYPVLATEVYRTRPASGSTISRIQIRVPGTERNLSRIVATATHNAYDARRDAVKGQWGGMSPEYGLINEMGARLYLNPGALNCSALHSAEQDEVRKAAGIRTDRGSASIGMVAKGALGVALLLLALTVPSDAHSAEPPSAIVVTAAP